MIALDDENHLLQLELKYLLAEKEYVSAIRSKYLPKFDQWLQGRVLHPISEAIIEGKKLLSEYRDRNKNTDELVNQMYKELALILHPDKTNGSTTNEFQQLQQAKESNDVDTMKLFYRKFIGTEVKIDIELALQINELKVNIKQEKSTCYWAYYMGDEFDKKKVEEQWCFPEERDVYLAQQQVDVLKEENKKLREELDLFQTGLQFSS